MRKYNKKYKKYQTSSLLKRSNKIKPKERGFITNWLNSKKLSRILKTILSILTKDCKNKSKIKKKEFKRKYKKRKKLCYRPKNKKDTRKDVSNVVLDNIFLENVQLIKVEDSVISVDLQIIITEIVQSRLMILLTAFTVERKDILQDNVPIIRKVCTEKEVHALAVVQ